MRLFKRSSMVICILCVTSLLGQTLFAATESTNATEKVKVEEKTTTNQKEEAGVIKNWMIEPQYEDTLNFVDGKAATKQKGLWGVINKKGEWLIKPQFEELRNFSEGLAAAKKGNLWGFINEKSEWVIKPQYSEVLDFSEGLAAVWNAETDEMYGIYMPKGYIDQKGMLKISVNDGGKTITDLGSFYNGLACVSRPAAESGQAIMDKKGNILKDKEGNERWFILVTNFDNNRAAALSIENFEEEPYYKYHLGILNTKGEMVTNIEGVDTEHLCGFGTFINGYVTAYVFECNENGFVSNEKAGVISEQGKMVIPFNYANIGEYSEGVFQVLVGTDSDNQKVGFIDANNKVVIEPQYTGTSNFVSGVATVLTKKEGEENETLGTIDATGKMIIAPIYEFGTISQSDEVVALRQDGKWGFVEIKEIKEIK